MLLPELNNRIFHIFFHSIIIFTNTVHTDTVLTIVIIDK